MTEVSEQAIEAGIATSSTWPIRNEEERAAYRKRVETLLEAAFPVLRDEIYRELRRAAAALENDRSADPGTYVHDVECTILRSLREPDA